ncbi:MAG TPA: VOC family protein [Myxococcales bacterium]|nr:VOC family protein [Myxococcales bacterium]
MIRICVDVSDLEQAIAFYRDGLGLTPGRRLKNNWVEMLGAEVPIDLLTEKAGSSPSPKTTAVRSFERHWTPVHLDFVVANLDEAVEKAKAAGATVDREAQQRPYGRIAVLADPFGNGFCLLEMQGRGYDEMLNPR